MPSDQQLHLAALQGNLEHLKTVLETGKVHVDCRDKVSVHSLITCLLMLTNILYIQLSNSDFSLQTPLSCKKAFH